MRKIVAAAVAVVLGVAAIGQVSAAPPNGEVFELDCGAAGQVTVVVPPGNGDWTPGILPDGGAFIPVAFVDFSATFIDNEGNVFEETAPDSFKGNGNAARGKTLIACSFSQTFEEDGGTGTFSGTVYGFIAGRR